MTITLVRQIIAAGTEGMAPGDLRALDQWLIANGYEPTWSDRPGQPSRGSGE